MMVQIYAIADEVASIITDGGLGVTATRIYLVDDDLPALTTQRVVVLPVEETRESNTRSSVLRTIVIAVVVLKKLDNSDGTTIIDNDEVDIQLALMESIVELIENKSLPVTKAGWVLSNISLTEIMAEGALQERRMFQSTATLTFIVE